MILKKFSLFNTVIGSSVLAFSLCSLAFAEDSFEPIVKKKEKEPELVPNLTVTFNLNSALDDEKTKYYSQIVEELLLNLPRRVELHGENKRLLSDYDNLDKMKVLAYLPTSKEEGLSGQRELRYLDVEFFAPKDLSYLPEGSKNAVVVQKQRYEDFLNKVSNMKGADERVLIDMNAAFDETARLATTIGQNDINPPKVAKLQPATQAKVKASVDASKKEAKKEKPKAKTSSSKLELPYFGDEVAVSSENMEKVKKFTSAFKGKNIQKVRIVSMALDGIGKTANSISLSRMSALQKFMQEQGLDVEKKKWSAVMVEAPLFQSLKIEVVAEN